MSLRNLFLTLVLGLALCGVSFAAEGGRDEVRKECFSDGKIKAEIPYKSGRPEGVGKEFSQDGKVVAGIEYKNGKEISRFECDENGNLLPSQDGNRCPEGYGLVSWSGGVGSVGGFYCYPSERNSP